MTTQPNIFCAHREVRPLESLVEHPRNPNKHPPEQLRLLGKIIATNGWRSPICVSARSGFVVKGHGRLQAARLAGMTHAPVDVQDYATEADEYADMIADNRIAELAEMDLGALNEAMAEAAKAGLEDPELAGFTDAALAELVAENTPQSEADSEPKIDKAEELRAKWGVELGQIWELGAHRIACGDSVTTCGRLCGGDGIDLVVTDPPYGVDYDGGTTKREKLAGDATADLYLPFLKAIKPLCNDHAAVYLWYADGDAAVTAAVTAAGFCVRSNLIWNKNQAQFGALSAQYKQKHEPFLYLHIKGKSPQWFGPTNEVSVWDVSRSGKNEHHPTQKPVELFTRAIENSSIPGQIVFDGFSGSGTTIIACERTGRKCRAIEISPAYVAVAIQRWADTTGGTPKLLTNG